MFQGAVSAQAVSEGTEHVTRTTGPQKAKWERGAIRWGREGGLSSQRPWNVIARILDFFSLIFYKIIIER